MATSGRPPTPAEIVATNPNMHQTCDKCHTVQWATQFGTFENMLHITFSGGYDEYVDEFGLCSDENKFHLCHECAHALMANFFNEWDFTNWHPRTEDAYCDGWTSDKWFIDEGGEG